VAGNYGVRVFEFDGTIEIRVPPPTRPTNEPKVPMPTPAAACLVP
jgi:hypothetical protein